jgi:hypothetical protein
MNKYTKGTSTIAYSCHDRKIDFLNRLSGSGFAESAITVSTFPDGEELPGSSSQTGRFIVLAIYGWLCASS